MRYLRAQEPAVAEDLAGDVWLAVARGIDRFVGDESNFRAWLFSIGRNRLRDHRRKAGRRRTDPVPHERLDLEAGRGAGSDPAALVLDRISAQEAMDILTTGLSPDQAEVVRLRVVGGLEVAEVAEVMGRTAGSVRVLCHRALHRLADRFGAEVMVE